MSTHYQAGDAISGERIAVSTRKFEKKHQVINPSGSPQFSYKFSIHSICVIEKPLQISTELRKAKTYYEKGEILTGERIAGMANNNTLPNLIRRTGAHRGTLSSLIGNAYCVIEAPLKFIHN